MSVMKLLRRNIYTLIVLMAFLAFISIVLAYAYRFNGGLSYDQGRWGEFGDFLGGTLNPILGFLTVIILVSTLKVQRKELRESRKALKRNGELVSEQLKLLKAQALEATFFKLLEDFDKTPVVDICRKYANDRTLLYAIYAIKEFPAESEECPVIFGKFVPGVQLGDFRYVVLDKFMTLAWVAGNLENNSIHLNLLKTTAGVALSAAIVQHSIKSAEVYGVFTSVPGVIAGVHHRLIFEEDVARRFLNETQYQNFLKSKDTSDEYFKRKAEEFLE